MSLPISIAQSNTSQKNLPLVPCRICRRFAATAVVLDSGEAKLLRCGHCGVTMLDPPPTAADLARHFADDYINDDERIEKTFERSREAILSEVAQNILRRKTFGNILDIGCAGGYFLNRYFTKPGWNRHGLEPSHYAARKAAAAGIRVFEGNALSVKLPQHTFDVISAMDVFCYFLEPQRELEVMRRSMKPKGLLFIELPLAEAQLLRNTGATAFLAGGAGRLLTKCGHLYFFNRSSIELLLLDAGFQIEAFLPLPANNQGHFYKNLVFRTYYWGSKVAWHLSAHNLMLGPNFLLIASLK